MEKYTLAWDSHSANLNREIQDLRIESDFFNVSLGCSDDISGRVIAVDAHKVVISAYSPILKSILLHDKRPNIFIYLQDMNIKILSSLLDFMYQGEVSVLQDDLKYFLRAAEKLRIKGIIGDDNSKSTLNENDNIEKNDLINAQSILKRQ